MYSAHQRLGWRAGDLIKVKFNKIAYDAKILVVSTFSHCQKMEAKLDHIMDEQDIETDNVMSHINDNNLQQPASSKIVSSNLSSSSSESDSPGMTSTPVASRVEIERRKANLLRNQYW